MASTTTPPASGDETLVEHLIRSTKNCWTACVGGVQKSDEIARIKYKETEIRSRKQKFGVEYLDLVRKGASEEELKNCVEVALKAMETTENEIAELQKEIDRVDAETKAKLVAKPGTPAAAAAPAAPAAPVAAPAAPAAAPVAAPVSSPETATEPVAASPSET
jgi:hypothetical protein